MISNASPTTAVLRALPLFEKLSDAAIEQLQPHIAELRFSGGELILREGDYCDGAYYIVDGAVELRFAKGGDAGARPRAKAVAPPPARGGFFNFLSSKRRRDVSQRSGDGSVVLAESPVAIKPGERAVLGIGEIFGEGSALSRYPIATDIVAASDVKCLLIRAPALRAMLELPELESFKQFFDQRYRERTLRAHLGRVELFEGVSDAVLGKLADRAELVTYKPGKRIAEQGKASDAFLLVRGGYVQVTMKMGEKDLAVTYLRKGDWAGEAALLLDEPWPYSLTALDNVELVKISRAVMQEVMADVPALEGKMWQATTARLKQRGRTSANPLAAQTLQYAMDSGLIRGESVLMIDLNSCTRCDECVRACADTHAGIPRFVREGDKFQNFSITTACYHCTDPVCMIGCPTGAITRPFGTLEVTINQATCIGCGNCSKRCPWGNIQTVQYMSAERGEEIALATKCDLCVGREEGPACVQMCPHGATVRVSFRDQELIEEMFSR